VIRDTLTISLLQDTKNSDKSQVDFKSVSYNSICYKFYFLKFMEKQRDDFLAQYIEQMLVNERGWFILLLERVIAQDAELLKTLGLMSEAWSTLATDILSTSQGLFEELGARFNDQTGDRLEEYMMLLDNSQSLYQVVTQFVLPLFKLSKEQEDCVARNDIFLLASLLFEKLSSHLGVVKNPNFNNLPFTDVFTYHEEKTGMPKRDEPIVAAINQLIDVFSDRTSFSSVEGVTNCIQPTKVSGLHLVEEVTTGELPLHRFSLVGSTLLGLLKDISFSFLN
jgi:hypothetical protein